MGMLSKLESHLGRSLIVNLAKDGTPTVSVDHRNIKWFILRNVKYIANPDL